MQGKHAEAVTELSKLSLTQRIFPPEESSFLRPRTLPHTDIYASLHVLLLSRLSNIILRLWIVDHLFVAIFDHLKHNCQDQLEAVGKQYPFEPLEYLPKTLRLTIQEGVQMLKDRDRKLRFFAGNEHPFGDRPVEDYVMPPRQVREMRPRVRRALV